jgi:hypothetical protein
MSLLLDDDLKDAAVPELGWPHRTIGISQLKPRSRRNMTFTEIEEQELEQQRLKQSLMSIGAVLL